MLEIPDSNMASLMLAIGQRRSQLPLVCQKEIDLQMKVLPTKVNALVEASKLMEGAEDEYNTRLRELALANLNALIRMVEVLLEDVAAKKDKLIQLIN